MCADRGQQRQGGSQRGMTTAEHAAIGRNADRQGELMGVADAGHLLRSHTGHAGQTTLLPAYQSALQPVIAPNWV